MWSVALTLLIYMLSGACATMVDTTHTGTRRSPQPTQIPLPLPAASTLLSSFHNYRTHRPYHSLLSHGKCVYRMTYCLSG